MSFPRLQIFKLSPTPASSRIDEVKALDENTWYSGKDLCCKVNGPRTDVYNQLFFKAAQTDYDCEEAVPRREEETAAQLLVLVAKTYTSSIVEGTSHAQKCKDSPSKRQEHALVGF